MRNQSAHRSSRSNFPYQQLLRDAWRQLQSHFDALLQYSRLCNDRRKCRRSRSVAPGIECLEYRYLLSSAPVEVATPAYESATPASGVKPATSAAPTGYTPQQMLQAYGFNQVTFSNGTVGNGSGTTIAIVDAYDDPNIANDLHQFDLAFGLPDTTLTKVNQSGGTSLPSANSNWITEIALDVEWAHAIAPGAKILLVEANSNALSDLLAAVTYASSAPGVVAVSMSWDSGEFPSEIAYDSVFTTPAGHNGVSFIAASGDSGAPTSYPAASPNVLSVGGTTLNLNQGNYSSESGWAGSGGGLSSDESQPSYQNGVVTQSKTQRANPDVAYDADPNTGFPVYDSYNNGTIKPWGQWGGTSDAAPQWAALVAIADQGRAIAGLGSLDGGTQLLPDLYQLPKSDFHDITTGTSDGNPNEKAGSGYDLVTGLGSPIANLVIAGLVDGTNSSSLTHLVVSVPTTVNSGTTFSITVSALTASNSVNTSYLGTISFSTSDSSSGIVLPTTYTFTAADKGVHTFTGVKLISPGPQSITAKDTKSSAIVGTASVTVLIPGSPPAVSGSTATKYVKGQSATTIDPSLSITNWGSTTLSSATVSVANFVASDDVLSFVNNNSSLFGNITGSYNSHTGVLTLTSSGSTATVLQFQSALRAVTYFNQSGDKADLGTRTITFQVFNGKIASNVLTSSVIVSNALTSTTLSSSATSLTYGQSVTLVATVTAISSGSSSPTAGAGTVQFLDGGSVLSGTVVYSTANGSLVATLTTTGLSSGSHSITALYSGNASFAGSSSAPIQLSLQRATTTITMTTSAAFPVYGAPLTLTANVGVVNPGTGVPTVSGNGASVRFADGRYFLDGTVTYSVVNGHLIATMTTTGLVTGVHDFQAIYSGDTNYAGSYTATFKQAVLAVATTAKASSSTTTAVVGQSVTITATIAGLNAATSLPSAVVADAAVKFVDGTTTLPGNVAYGIANGCLIATLSISSLTAGVHSIKAVYAGDANFSASTSTALSLKVGPFSTRTSLTASSVSPAAGQSVTLVSTISSVTAGAGVPTAGSTTSKVQFFDGTTVLSGTIVYSVVNGNLIASLTTASLTNGVNSITAVYSGDSSFSGSSSAILKITPVRATTICTVLASNIWPVYGAPCTLTATVSVARPGSGTPTAGAGTANVQYYDGATLLSGTVNYSVVNGNLVATLITSSLSVGAHSINVSYSGDATNSNSTSSVLKLQVLSIATSATVSSSTSSAVIGQPITLTATVSDMNGGTLPPSFGTGVATVKFVDGAATLLGTVTYSVINGKLIATLTTSALSVGSHSIKAVYSGNANFSASTSVALVLKVAVQPSNTTPSNSGSEASFATDSLWNDR